MQSLVIYPGRFQPFHLGHKKVFDFLRAEFPQESLYIATSNKTELPRSPLDFTEKKALMQLTGVPISAIVQTRNPYQAPEITVNYAANQNCLIMAVSEKDMAQDPRFKFSPKKDGSPSYFQPYQSQQACETFDKHGYIFTVPTFPFQIAGQAIRGASDIRALYTAANTETRRQLFQEVFGGFDNELFDMLNQKL